MDTDRAELHHLTSPLQVTRPLWRFRMSVKGLGWGLAPERGALGVTIHIMRAFKFRSVETLHYVLDILIHRRVFCAPMSLLNDTREGDLRIGKGNGDNEIFNFAKDVGNQVRELRVCALSATVDNHLLWAHYAGGYSGIAIEVDIPDEDARLVEYSDELILASDLFNSYSVDEAARTVLLRKYRDWAYEKEVRIISSEPYYMLTQPISRVVLGSRVMPAVASAIQILCKHHNIEVELMVVSDKGIYTVNRSL